MFSFDVTLIVQMIHFFAIWWFIDRFLFKKLVTAVRNEDAFTAGLRKKLDEEVHTLASIVEQKNGEWQRFKELYKEQIPSAISSYVVSQDIHVQPPVEIAQEKKVEIIHDISEEFIRQISHD